MPAFEKTLEPRWRTSIIVCVRDPAYLPACRLLSFFLDLTDSLINSRRLTIPLTPTSSVEPYTC
jgi:hypothetical protein